MLQEYLERSGYQVEAVPSGEAGLAAAARTLPQLAVIDTVLPGMSGVETCRALRALPGAQEMYILLLASRDDGTEPRELIEAGANDYLVKPIDRKLMQLRLDVAAKYFINVRQRQHALAALERADARYRLLADHSPDLIWQTDDSGRLRYVSPAVERIAGVPLDAALQMPVAELFAAEDQPALRRALRGLLKGDDPGHLRVELRLRHPQQPRWTETLIHVASRRPLSVIGVTRDISDRRKVEQQALERQMILERAASAVPGLLYLFDLQAQRSRILTTDGADEVVDNTDGDPLLTRMHPEDYLAWMAHIGEHAAGLAENEALRFQYRLRDEQGEWRTYETREVIFDFDASGRVRTLLGIAIDPVRLAVLEQERLQARAAIAALLALQPSPAVVCDEQGWVLWYNDAAGTLLDAGEAGGWCTDWRFVVAPEANTGDLVGVRLLDGDGCEQAAMSARVAEAELGDAHVRVLLLDSTPHTG